MGVKRATPSDAETRELLHSCYIAEQDLAAAIEAAYAAGVDLKAIQRELELTSYFRFPLARLRQTIARVRRWSS